VSDKIQHFLVAKQQNVCAWYKYNRLQLIVVYVL